MSGKTTAVGGLISRTTDNPTAPFTYTFWCKRPSDVYLYMIGSLYPLVSSGVTTNFVYKTTGSWDDTGVAAAGTGWVFFAATMYNDGSDKRSLYYWTEGNNTSTPTATIFNASDSFGTMGGTVMVFKMGAVDFDTVANVKFQHVRAFDSILSNADLLAEKNSSTYLHSGCAWDWYWNGNATPTDLTATPNSRAERLPALTSIGYDDADNPTLTATSTVIPSRLSSLAPPGSLFKPSGFGRR